MLFNFFKKKPAAEIPDNAEKTKKAQQTIEDEIAKQEAREKKKREAGPNLAPLIVLAVSVLLGGVFWIYGRIAESGIGSLFEMKPNTQETISTPRPANRDGLIIFEKEK